MKKISTLSSAKILSKAEQKNLVGGTNGGILKKYYFCKSKGEFYITHPICMNHCSNLTGECQPSWWTIVPA